MSPRPNPTQHTVADDREFREYVRLRAPDGKALDKRDLARAFNEGSHRGIDSAVRRAALAWVFENMPDRFIVRAGFAEDIRRYEAGEGEFPDDAKAITGEEQRDRRLKRAMNPPDVVVGAGELKLDEEGRAPGQEPRGRFARAGDVRFEPDSR